MKSKKLGLSCGDLGDFRPVYCLKMLALWIYISWKSVFHAMAKCISSTILLQNKAIWDVSIIWQTGYIA